MKHIILFAALVLACHYCPAQMYISLVPSLTNTAGTIAEKSNLSLEVGKQWDVFSLGLDLGKTSLGKVAGRDTTVYLEVRPNLNVFQEGKFTNTITPGIGVIFNSKENLMTEFTTGIEYAYKPTLHLNVFFGQYYYSGRESASNATFWGLSLVYYFAAYDPNALLNKKDAKK